jgi:ribonuclease P protein component
MQRQYRLHRPDDFERLRREGRAYQHRLMLLSVVPNALAHNRYGFITAKHLGNAVTRNRVRRLLREAVRLLHPGLKSGYDFVLIARRPVVGEPFTSVRRVVGDLFRQAGAVQEETP